MLLLFLILFIAFEAVLIKSATLSHGGTFSVSFTTDLEMQIDTHITRKPIKSAGFLIKVEIKTDSHAKKFHAMPARELVSLINDPVLAKFAIERKYSLEQTVSVVKRIKAWGQNTVG